MEPGSSECDPEKMVLKRYWEIRSSHLAAHQPTLDHYKGASLSHPMLIPGFERFQPEGHQESRNEVRSLIPTDCLVGFNPGTFQF